MPEPNQIIFTHKELAEILVRRQGIRKGVWGIFIKFGIKGANVGASDSDIVPAAIVPVLEIGLQRFPKENNLTVDAAKLSGQSSKRTKPKGPTT